MYEGHLVTVAFIPNSGIKLAQNLMFNLNEYGIECQIYNFQQIQQSMVCQRLDSKGSSNGGSEQASMLLSVIGEKTSLESMRVCEDNKENAKK